MGKKLKCGVIADKGAKLRSGFSEQITPKNYRIESTTITPLRRFYKEYDIQPAVDVFFLPTGKVLQYWCGAL